MLTVVQRCQGPRRVPHENGTRKRASLKGHDLRGSGIAVARYGARVLVASQASAWRLNPLLHSR